MNVIEAIKERCSVRAYQDKDVEDEKLQTLLECARLAPSAANLQEWRFVVVRDKKMRARLADAANNQSFVAQAPVVLVCCAETEQHTMRCGEKSYPIDVAIAIDHITLAALELGLGTCWIGAFYADKVRKLLGVPESVPVVSLLTLGYPISGATRAKTRLPLEEIVRYEHW
ncbi:nitroreductase [candidate division TA06 bacterium]|uniref:Nitroreductase n=1 Tax=candidate division TA06 bacterium TaxID=2250710 RepID=A0A523XRX6_UNCT6|nr:MAG: nitroreductase [candidate division TA06 bacterium]